MTDRFIGQVLAERYRVDALLGTGAMGSVYRARHVKIGRPFAIKLLHRRLLADSKVLRRFDREAEIAGTMQHPNIVGVVDAGETDGQRYLVMELAEGETLGSVITNSGPMPGPRVLRIAQQLCDGLEHAHERGLVHRDFKPDNVIITRDHDGREVPRIVDFGIALLGEARSSGESDRLTTKGLVLGTPHYMAPEQARGVQVDHRLDLFALGVICYEMLTGRMPYDGNGVDVARANLATETPPMGVRVPDLDVDPLLEAFTRKLMMKSPNRRPQTAREACKLLDLIASNRHAAAKELGVDPEMEVLLRRRTQRVGTEHSQPHGQAQVATKGSMLSENVYIASTEKTPAVRWRGRYFAAAAALLVSFTVVYGLMIRTDVAMTANVAIDSSEEPMAMKLAERAVVEMPKPAFAKQVPLPVTAPAPLPIKPPPAQIVIEAPSGTAVAMLYTTVGRRLRKLENGDPLVQELWIRYRRIRLNEALATPGARSDTTTTLKTLDAKLDAL